jgi:two-component system cell cycle response regulator DivK
VNELTPSHTVLLVEDNPHNRKIFSGMLRHSGFEVIEAESGDHALEEVAKKRPSLILMDLSIPGIDGWECTRRLKASAATCDIPIIALTAHAMRGDEERAREAGCDGYLAKPVSPKKVVEEVRRYLAKLPEPR